MQQAHLRPGECAFVAVLAARLQQSQEGRPRGGEVTIPFGTPIPFELAAPQAGRVVGPALVAVRQQRQPVDGHLDRQIQVVPTLRPDVVPVFQRVGQEKQHQRVALVVAVRIIGKGRCSDQEGVDGHTQIPWIGVEALVLALYEARPEQAAVLGPAVGVIRVGLAPPGRLPRQVTDQLIQILRRIVHTLS